MSEQVAVSAGWALWAKHPGSNRDYSVLASSREPLTDQEFAGVLSHFAPGNPTSERGLPGSLPWVTISQVRVEQQGYLGITIQKDAEQVDDTGRPIIRTSYFCIPHAQLAATPVSYAGLYQVLKDVRLPPERDGLIHLSIPRLDPEAIAAGIIGTYGEQAVAAAAALLLSGSVNIVGSEGSAVEQRLEDLDAVAAMLPNGYRTDLTAATWSDSAARHHIRLAFAARARDDVGVVQWRSAPAGLSGRDPGDSYLSLLRQVRQRRPGQSGLAQLLTFLADDAVAHTFDQPQYAIERVRDFDLPFVVWNATRNGTADVDHVRAVFDRSRITELPSEGRQVLLEFLIDAADTQDWPRADRWWDVVVSDNPGVVLPTLVRTGRRLLWTPAPSLSIREPLTLAAKHDLLDSLLAELIVVPASPSGLSGAVSAAAQLLVDWVLAASPAAFPRTQHAIASNPLIACELLTLQAGSEHGAGAAVSFVKPVLHAFLHPFFIAVGAIQGTVDQFGFGQLARQDTDCVRALLQTASYSGHLPQVLPGFVAWLAGGARGPSDADISLYWRGIIWTLTPADAESQAWLDLALLVSGNAPRYLLTDLDRKARLRYNECLASAWSDVVASEGPALDDRLADMLGSSLAETTWAANARHADAVVDLTMRLTDGGKRDRLEAMIAGSVSNVPEAARSEFARGWLARVQRSRPGVVQDGTLATLRHPPRGVTAAQLAKLCVQAFRNDLDMGEACQALADSHTIATGRAAAAVLAELRQGLVAAEPGGQKIRDWLCWFIQKFADGTFGSQTADEFRRLAVAHTRNEISYCLDELFIAATGGRQHAPPELSDEDVAELEWISQSFDKIARDAKKRGRPRWPWADRQDRGEEGRHDGGTGEPGR